MPGTLIIVNPSANRGRTARQTALRVQYVARNTPAEVQTTTRAGHARELAASAAKAGFDRVVAVGGDGTVHETINGLMQVDAASRPALGVVAAGSGNDFAWACGLSRATDAALHDALHGRLRAIDVGAIEDDGGRSAYFGNTAGMLVVGAINALSRRIRRLPGAAMYAAATLQAIARHHVPTRIALTADGQLQRANAIMLTVGNGAREGGAFLTNPNARNDDGRLDWMLGEFMPRWRMLALLPRVVRGTHLSARAVTGGRASEITIEADRALPVHVDGEVFADFDDNVRRLAIRVCPGALKVVCRAPPGTR